MQTSTQPNKLREFSADAVRDHRAAAEYYRYANRPDVIRHADGVIEIPESLLCGMCGHHEGSHRREGSLCNNVHCLCNGFAVA